MRFIEKTDCKLSASKWQCQWPQNLQNKKHLSTFGRLFSGLFASWCARNSCEKRYSLSHFQL